MTYPTLKSVIREICEEERDEVNEASDIHKHWHHDLIKAWRADVDVGSCYDAYMNPVDLKAENLLEQISATSAHAVYGQDWTELQRLLSEYWFRQISSTVDRLIVEVHEDMISDRQSYREAQDEWRAEQRREDFKEFAA